MLKRAFDVTLVLILLPPLALVLSVIGILIKWDSPGPVFYRGRRSGLGGRPFQILKFRTMVVNAEQVGGPSTALNDPRLTKIGRVLRKYKVDELPQLINILRGEMSFVGPRPQVEAYTRLYDDEERAILSVKPGLTDYASIEFIHLDALLGDEEVDQKYMREIEPKKNRLRVRYVREQSFANDLRIILLSVVRMVRIRELWNTKH